MSKPSKEEFLAMSEDALKRAIDLLANKQGCELIEALVDKLSCLEAQLTDTILSGELEKTMPTDLNIVEVQFLKMAFNFTVNAAHAIDIESRGS